MIVLESNTVLWKDVAKLYEVLKNGGLIKTGKFGIKFTKFAGGLYIQSVAIDTSSELKDNVYYEKVSNIKEKVSKEPKTVFKEIDKKVEIDTKVNDATDLFSF
jgi:hypothetical protein